MTSENPLEKICHQEATCFILTTLQDGFRLPVNYICKKLGISAQTFNNQKDKIFAPQKGTIDLIKRYLEPLLAGIPSELSRKQLRLKPVNGKPAVPHSDYIRTFSEHLKESFSQQNSFVTEGICSCKDLKHILKYLYDGNYVRDLGKSPFSFFLSKQENMAYLKTVLEEKIRINANRYRFFSLEGLKPVNSDQKSSSGMDINNCSLIRFQNGDRKSYSLLVNFNYMEKDPSVSSIENSVASIADQYQVDMISLFTFSPIPAHVKSQCRSNNIYIEFVDNIELMQRKASLDYVYLNVESPLALSNVLNNYSDLILGRLSRYYSAVYKNLMFQNRTYSAISSSYLQKGILWDATPAALQHLDFQTERLQNAQRQKGDARGDTAIAIGFLSFPVLLRMTSSFKRILFLDNSNDCIQFYRNAPFPEKNNCQLEFIPFTSSLGEYLTEQYQLCRNVDLVLVGTGYASLIKNIKRYCQYINLWLKPDGIAYFSFLNADFFYNCIDEETLSRRVDFLPSQLNNRCRITFSRLKNYSLYCNTRDYGSLRALLSNYFSVSQVYSYPLVSILHTGNQGAFLNVLNEMDWEYSLENLVHSNSKNHRYGYYIDALVTKQSATHVKLAEPTGESISHGFAMTISSKLLELNSRGYQNDGSSFIKVLFLKKKTSRNLSNITVILLPAIKQLQEINAQTIYVQNTLYRMLNIRELNELGLEIGNITPFFHFQRNLHLEKYYDASLENLIQSSVFFGTGDCRCTERMERNQFFQKLEEYHYQKLQLF